MAGAKASRCAGAAPKLATQARHRRSAVGGKAVVRCVGGRFAVLKHRFARSRSGRKPVVARGEAVIPRCKPVGPTVATERRAAIAHYTGA